MNGMLQSKTFWAGVTTIIGATSGFFMGELVMADAAQLASTGLIGIFLRAGINKQ